MGKPWFHPKAYGYGAGLPCSWEGWLVLAGFLGVMVGTAFIGDDTQWRLRLAVGGLAVMALVIICAAKTRGGWRWRWGQGE